MIPTDSSPSINVPPAPREPSPRARRLVYRYAGSQFVLLLVGAIFLAIGVPMGAVFCWYVPAEVALDLIGKAGTAQVVSAEIDGRTVINGHNPRRIVFKLEAGGGAVEGDSLSTDERFDKLSPGDTVEVDYVPGHPVWARVRGSRFSLFGYFGLFVLIFPGVGGALLFFAVRSNRREIRAFRFGTPAMAKVTFAGPDTSTTMNGRHPFQVVWSLERNGEKYEGSISSMDPTELEGYAQSQELVVLYDPENPAINTLWVP